ncbi:DNA-binding LytR/AlgR family response regulator [Pedobacter cryoconitis]|uniref:DNA-binding LytR/AlgR family response regulator n=1 Tax=Pedobacter cryoconitis TaxID=188932 RepID=A0A7W9DYV4_9SPHI|nr:LytTR family DNA-binding domain-containing protein [Pedobacter cryoconitis]MBB5635589.1 DNA-binding LytR/AlgR family response regulator [Pedobacter cryoconitis]MBB6273536.1 DNA-binding LytR/AlgR family response regulator [Pedobacter cryoconitis]
MNVLIIEDEKLNAIRLQKILLEIDSEIKIVATLDTIADSVQWLRTNPHPNLILMDVRLADGICFEIFTKVEITAPVIFTTAYDEYALRAFKVNSIDYLLKPIDIDELKGSISKFKQQNTKKISSGTIEEVVAIIKKQNPNYRSRFLIPYRDGYKTITVPDIAYFYSENKITNIVTCDAKEQAISYTMDELEEQLDPAVFFRANRQYLINIKSLESIHNYFNGKLKLMLAPAAPSDIHISKEKASQFKRWLDS